MNHWKETKQLAHWKNVHAIVRAVVQQGKCGELRVAWRHIGRDLPLEDPWAIALSSWLLLVPNVTFLALDLFKVLLRASSPAPLFFSMPKIWELFDFFGGKTKPHAWTVCMQWKEAYCIGPVASSVKSEVLYHQLNRLKNKTNQSKCQPMPLYHSKLRVPSKQEP